ncbi:hypothetical protein CLV92_10734 [Kineococcus xinjiangensis]|uniref:Uncharacterized protein n=1 Tax=Kineococcus xinjiangensis TaxID=512762 RepID=A0A2S6IJX3_9ACTN|nr:hypothetical protein [Kineococcus xinjiangensis]PPK94532.1 hypothetical protein CLV92_10734 [Kineococcus xinjiangensis]
MSTHLLLEGSDLDALLAQAREEHGEGARIVRAERVRSGGVGGFFAKEHYQVTVEVPEPGEILAPLSAQAAEAARPAAPAVPAPVQQAPVQQAPVQQAPVQQAPVHQVPAPRSLGDLLAAADAADGSERLASLVGVVAAPAAESGEQPSARALAAARFAAAAESVAPVLPAPVAGGFTAAAFRGTPEAPAPAMPAPAMPAPAMPAPAMPAPAMPAPVAAAPVAAAPSVPAPVLAAAAAAEAPRVTTPHRPISTEGDDFAFTLATMRRHLTDGMPSSAPNVTPAVPSVTAEQAAPAEAAPSAERPLPVDPALSAAQAGTDLPAAGGRHPEEDAVTEPNGTPIQYASKHGLAGEQERTFPTTGLGYATAEEAAAPTPEQPVAAREQEAAQPAPAHVEVAPEAPRAAHAAPVAQPEPAAEPALPVAAHSAPEAAPEQVEPQASVPAHAAPPQPAQQEPIVQQEPIIQQQPQVAQQAPQEQAPQQPAQEQPVAQAPQEQPVAQAPQEQAPQPVVQQPVVQQPVVQQPVVQQPAVQYAPQPVVQQPVVQQPVAPQPVVQPEPAVHYAPQPVVQQPVAPQPVVQPEPAVHYAPQPVVQQPQVVQPAPVVVQPAPVIIQPAPVVVQPVAHQEALSAAPVAAPVAVSSQQPAPAVVGDHAASGAQIMDSSYGNGVTTYSETSAPTGHAAAAEHIDPQAAIRIAQDIPVPAPLRAGPGDLVLVVGEPDAVVTAGLLVADEIGSDTPVVIGRAEGHTSVGAGDLAARLEQARGWSAPLTVTIPARPTAADAQRAARFAAEFRPTAVVVAVDATRRASTATELVTALRQAGAPVERVAVTRSVESTDPLDVLSLGVPVGYLDGRPATTGAWVGLLLDAALPADGTAAR